MKNILFASSECVPFVKTGGLADVVGALPKYLNPKQFDVRVVLPYYSIIPEKYKKDFKFTHVFYMDYTANHANRQHVAILEYNYGGIKFYFIDNEYYFKCEGNSPYTDDLRWDIERFTFFDKAVLAAMPVIGFHPDIIHCHDWQTGFIPVFLHSTFATHPFYNNTKTIMTIHNLRFQGIWSRDAVKYYTDLPDYMFTPDKLEYKNDANMLKGGLVYADYITTVSESYAEEIKTPEYGEGLDGLLRARSFSLRGIVNGIDYQVYNPESDQKIPFRYNINNVRDVKTQNKLSLQEKLGLPKDQSKFMIAIISRLTDQKGLDLIDRVADRITDPFTQLVVIGTGERRYEDMFRYYQGKYPDRVSANILYSDALAHELYAAADMMLVPSRFEPCGLTQLISLRYGTVPLVRETGGLKDTVEAYNEYSESGTGFSFTNYNAEDMLNVINYAKSVYFDKPDSWGGIISRGMQKDFSWGSSALQYEGMYNWLTYGI